MPMLHTNESSGQTIADSARRPPRSHPKGRVCAEPKCGATLSIYNSGKCCALHEEHIIPRTRGVKV